MALPMLRTHNCAAGCGVGTYSISNADTDSHSNTKPDRHRDPDRYGHKHTDRNNGALWHCTVRCYHDA